MKKEKIRSTDPFLTLDVSMHHPSALLCNASDPWEAVAVRLAGSLLRWMSNSAEIEAKLKN